MIRWTALLALILLATQACSSMTGNEYGYRLSCRGNQDFAQCNEVFTSETECRRAQNEMIRAASHRERGTCLRVKVGSG